MDGQLGRSRSTGRLTGFVPIACFILAAVTGLTSVGAVVGLSARSLDLRLGFDAYALDLAAPFVIVAAIALFAGRVGLRLRHGYHGARALSRVRLMVGVGLLPLLFGLVSSIGLGFLSSYGSGWIAPSMLLMARLGVPVSLLAWIACMAVAWIARAPTPSSPRPAVGT